MSRDGNGQYVLPSGNPVTPGTVIESEWANSTLQDVANALSTSLAYDGQTVPVNNLPMGGFRHTGVSDPSQRNQYVTLGMTQDGRDSRVVLSSGVNDLVGTLIGQMSSYYPGQTLSFQALATNTGAVTLNINGIGIRSVVLASGEQLEAGQLKANEFYQVFYTGTKFQLLNASVLEDIASKVDQNSITGWIRPESGTYPPLTLVNPTTVQVPAGSGYIVPPGDASESDIVFVTWPDTQVELQYLSSAFTTTLGIDSAGNVVQIPDQVLSGAFRSYIIAGVVSHVTGEVTGILTRPAVHGDDGYLYRDLTRILVGILLTGGQVSQGTAPLNMNVQEGVVFIPGSNYLNPDSPNNIVFQTQTNISFYPLAGTSTLGPATQLAPVTNYDPNFGGVITAIPGGAGTTVIHRLYWLNGTWIWEYGQRTYSTLAVAIQNLAYERAIFKVSSRLAGATLVSELAISKNCLAISDAATCIIIPRGGFEYVIGTAGGLDEAPQDGNLYGRKNASWSQVLDPSTPEFLGDITITKDEPRLILDYDPSGAGWGGIQMTVEGTALFDMRYTLPDKELSFRTYDDAGVLQSSTAVTQAGTWTFPAGVNSVFGFSIGSAFVIDEDGSNVIAYTDSGYGLQIVVDGGAEVYAFDPLGLTIPIAPTLASHATTKDYVDKKKEALLVALGSEVAPVTVGVKSTFRMPYGFTLTGLKASLNVAQAAGALLTIDVKEGGVSILSTLLTFDNGSKTTVGATTPVVISDPSLANDGEVTVEVTQIGDGTAIGAKISFLGYETV